MARKIGPLIVWLVRNLMQFDIKRTAEYRSFDHMYVVSFYEMQTTFEPKLAQKAKLQNTRPLQVRWPSIHFWVDTWIRIVNCNLRTRARLIYIHCKTTAYPPVAKPAWQFSHAICKFKSLSLFISLEIDCLYGL